MVDMAKCLSWMIIADHAAAGEFWCTEAPEHDGDHVSGPSGVRWPRLEQAYGAPILTTGAPSGDRLPMNDGTWERVARAIGGELSVKHALTVTDEDLHRFARAAIAELAPGTDTPDQAVQRVLRVCADFDANGNAAELGDPCADTWHKAARLVRAAVAGPQRAHDEEGS